MIIKNSINNKNQTIKKWLMVGLLMFTYKTVIGTNNCYKTGGGIAGATWSNYFLDTILKIEDKVWTHVKRVFDKNFNHRSIQVKTCML